MEKTKSDIDLSRYGITWNLTAEAAKAAIQKFSGINKSEDKTAPVFEGPVHDLLNDGGPG